MLDPAETFSRLMMSKKTDLGSVKIRNEVIGSIASLAAREVEGVVEVWRGSWPLGWLPGFSGVRVETRDQDVRLWLSLIVEYGANLPEVATRVQDRVQERVEQMTQLSAVEVHVSIHHVRPKAKGS